MNKKSEKITFVVILAAVIAALTTVAVLLVRMKMKKKRLYAEGEAVDYMMDDYDECTCGCCCDCDDEEKKDTNEVQSAEPAEEEAASEES